MPVSDSIAFNANTLSLDINQAHYKLSPQKYTAEKTYLVTHLPLLGYKLGYTLNIQGSKY